MQATKAFEDEHVRLMLAGTDAQQAEGLQQIDTTLRTRFCAGVRGFYPGLRSEDLADAWQQTLIALYQAAKKGEVDLDRPLLPWIWKVLRNKATDHTRRRTAFQGAIERVTHLLGNSQRAEAWNRKSPEEKADISARIRGAIGSMPPRQRAIIQVYLDNIDRIDSLEDLKEMVSAETGQVETLVAVKRARQEALKKVREVLGDGLQ